MLRAIFRKNENTQEWMHYGPEAVSQLSELIEFNSNPANKNAYGDSICAYIRIESETPMEAQEFWTSVGHELLSEFNITIEYFAMKCYHENGHANLFIEDLIVTRN